MTTVPLAVTLAAIVANGFSGAATGLVLFFVCAIYTHVLTGDYGSQFGLAIVFLALNAGALAAALL